MKKIAIIGSTGSIGTQTLEIVREQKDIEVVALAAGHNAGLLERQVREFRPKLAVLWEEEAAGTLRGNVRDLAVRVASGMDGLLEAATMPESEMLVMAIVGMLGIKPTLAAIGAGKAIALANKETLVTAGHLVMGQAAREGVPILPVDSEHSAIFQSLNGEGENRPRRILLTASGGPFRGWKREELSKVRPEDALRHPNWSMGPKVTVDSATMVNKGLEVMEAKWLFGADLSQIEVVVHPQSVIHSMVEFEDGAVIAQLGVPDMRLPIQYALYYPRRRRLSWERLDFPKLGSLTFEKPDLQAFPGLGLAYEAMRRGGNLPTAYNAANEKAVEMFLGGRIRFLEIPEIIEECMERCRFTENPSLDRILETEAEAHELIESRW